jgi:DNA primase
VIGIGDVLEHYGADMTRIAATGWRPVKCPFHDDRIASASVNIERGAFSCHACGMRGDAIALIEKNENTSYRGAIEWAAKILGQSNSDIRGAARRHAARDRHAWHNRIFD